MKERKSVGIVTGLVLVVLGLLAGLGLGATMNKDTIATKEAHRHTASDTKKSVELRNALVTLGVEHMTLTDTAVADALDGSPSADQTGAALYKNGTELGAAVGSVYGEEAENTFNTVWKLHLDQFVAYAVAKKQGDQPAAQKALDTIDAQYTKPLAQYLAKANPNLPEKTLEGALRDHVTMTASIIDQHVAGNYEQEARELAVANKHVASLMSTLADGIIAQYPDKFRQ